MNESKAEDTKSLIDIIKWIFECNRMEKKKITVEIEDPFEKEWKEKLMKKVASLRMTYEVRDEIIVITQRIVMQDLTEKALYAQRLSNEYDKLVEFYFNEVTFKINKTTNIDLIIQYYNDSHLFNWTVIGPNCIEYSEFMKKEIENRKKSSRNIQHLEQLNDFKDKELINELFNRGYDIFKINNS